MKLNLRTRRAIRTGVPAAEPVIRFRQLATLRCRSHLIPFHGPLAFKQNHKIGLLLSYVVPNPLTFEAIEICRREPQPVNANSIQMQINISLDIGQIVSQF
jgi:hypothetical protein